MHSDSEEGIKARKNGERIVVSESAPGNAAVVVERLGVRKGDHGVKRWKTP
jgi:hypothetical protein